MIIKNDCIPKEQCKCEESKREGYNIWIPETAIDKRQYQYIEVREVKIRPTWNEYFMSLAHLVKTRSTCLRRNIGCVIVKERRILTTGYNGAPAGLSHCTEPDVGCLREKLGVSSGQRHELCRAIHAEQNAIVQAAYHGVCIKGADIYVTNFPCSICAKMLINVGINNVFYEGDYPDENSQQYFKDAQIQCVRI